MLLDFELLDGRCLFAFEFEGLALLDDYLVLLGLGNRLLDTGSYNYNLSGKLTFLQLILQIVWNNGLLSFHTASMHFFFIVNDFGIPCISSTIFSAMQYSSSQL